MKVSENSQIFLQKELRSISKKNNRINITHACLEVQYHKMWNVHFSRPTKTPWKTVAYLGRYIKKPPLSMARLKHYDGRTVTFQYLNHRTGKNAHKTFSAFYFIQRFTQHIPDKGFRLIRYFGILANRVRGKSLPIVYRLIEQVNPPTPYFGFQSLKVNAFNHNPKQCILCGNTMTFVSITCGLKAAALQLKHQFLATRKAIPMPDY